MPAPIQFEAIAEDALLLRFGAHIELDTSVRVLAAAALLHARWPELEIVPAYASLLLRFDLRQWPQQHGRSAHQQLGEAALHLLQEPHDATAAARSVTVPVLYGGDAGVDLAEVAALCGCSIDEVIERHCAVEYRVAMLGFAPGFPYLLGLDPRLAVPRRRDPRQRVPAGSVAIGGSQTGIYPAALPGGWQLIGRTPLRLFDVAATPPAQLLPGDRVRFRPIDGDAYAQLAREAVG